MSMHNFNEYRHYKAVLLLTEINRKFTADDVFKG
jgi:hypothetical protein